MFRRSRGKKATVSLPKRKWKGGRPAPKEWDSTVSDLTVHKATEEEIQRRRLIHKSKNASAARRALGERAKKLFMDPASPGQVELEMKKLAILKEVLYDHDDLNEVLKRVDTTMSSVKTMFHGAPYRTSGNPNVTLAPGSKATNGPVSAREEPATQMSLLSDSVMDKRALNEEETSSEDEAEDEKFQSKVDYERFLNVLKDSLRQSTTQQPNGPGGDANMTPANNGNPGFQRAALNCTEEVKRTMAKFRSMDNETQEDANAEESVAPKKIDDTILKLTAQTNGEPKKKGHTVSFSTGNESQTLPPPRANITANNMTYENLQEAMESVANNLTEMENRRVNGSVSIDTTLKSDGLAGFTATLIDAVTRLTVYVNEAEAKLLATESHMEILKSQNDHQRALLDALTAELMSTQEQISNLKEQSSKETEERIKQHQDFKDTMQKEIKSLHEKIESLDKSNGKKTDAGDASGPHAPDSDLTDELVLVEASSDKEKREEALKSDMLSLLSALKSQDKEKSTQAIMSDRPGQTIPMNNVTTKGAAQTVASVESQLRHLQLQHAEAQNRLQELTQVAGILAGKVAETENQSSSSTSGPSTPATCNSSATPSILSGPISPREGSDDFRPMIPTSAHEEEDSGITITSSMFPNIDTGRPSVQSNSFSHLAPSPPVDRRFVEDMSSLKSSDRVNISDDSFYELQGQPLPTLLQTNIYGPSSHDNRGPTKPSYFQKGDANGKGSALPSFKPTGTATMQKPNPQSVTDSIQQTRFNLEDRIAELNRQHAEAQARLHDLIRKRTDGSSPSPASSRSSGSSALKRIQITLPTDDMLKTPQVHRPPEPFKPMTLIENSFM